jgi:TolB-like protein
MGVVYAAFDDQLGREVAIKTIRDESGDPTAHDRLWREARAAAAVAHPNVCHVYEVGRDGDSIYLVMELLEGEPLSARLTRGAMPAGEALTVALGMLSALEALHARGIVHRDLKPGNVFLTPHGVKLLDFGLARSRGTGPSLLDVRVTAPGVVAGTPHYMSPEQFEGEEAGPPSDLFAFGAVLFEMLTGRPAFEGATIWEVSDAIRHGHPPALSGGPGTSAIEAVVRRCLAKRPSDRFGNPGEVARDLRAAAALLDSAGNVPVQAATRLLVLPFQLLRPDPEIDFLGFSLADSLIASLTGLGPLVVRSSHVAQQFAAAALDLRRIAAECQVDVVLTGTLLRSGDRLRLVAQLVEAPGGAILWSKTAQVEMGDIFDVQDDLARQVIDSLALPLSGLDQGRIGRDVPASGHAYELYLRANHLAHATLEPSRLLAARELYAACLAEDPHFAPAWARIGRVYRVLAKYAGQPDEQSVAKAHDAFQRAFALNPDLPIAHHMYTYFEIEQLGRAEAAMTRLLGQVARMPNDADLLAGLVIACRYCGLLKASVAADARARRLDPAVRTSVQYTWALLNDEAKVRRFDDKAAPFVLMMLTTQLGRADEARRLLQTMIPISPPGERLFLVAVEAALDGRRDETAAAFDRMSRSGFRDPEGVLAFAIILAHAGVHDRAIALIERAIDGGFACPQIRLQPAFRPLHGLDAFERLMQRASSLCERSAAAFREADGHRLLGVPDPA